VLSGDDSSAEPSAAVLIAFDDEFLYLAARCRKEPHLTYETSDEARPRDGDLGGRDRVELLFDTNRDYASWLKLSIDYRGWPAESSFGSAAWNPQWFVAAQSGEGQWTIEAAIPWQDLHGARPLPGAAWAVSARRIVPQGETLAWPQGANRRPLGSGFGLLLFE
jgi:hypothetical protein